MARPHSRKAMICSSPSWWRRRIASHSAAGWSSIGTAAMILRAAIGVLRLRRRNAACAQDDNKMTANGRMLRRVPGTAGPSTPLALRSGDDNTREAQTEKAARYARTAFIHVGDDLLSHTLSRAVQSA